MSRIRHNPAGHQKVVAGLFVLIALAGALSVTTQAKDKKEKGKTGASQAKLFWDNLDKSKIVWPNPPAIARVRYVGQFIGEEPSTAATPKKSGWMDRMAGVATGESAATKPLYQLLTPYGVAVDSKNRLYVVDEKVGAIFIWDAETKNIDLIKHGVQARFKLITGLAIDDADHVFVSDSVADHVLVFDKQKHLEGAISEGMVSPAGLAVDDENRLLYVCDTELDQVLVYDADPPHKLQRTIGTRSKNHELTDPGQFSRPTNVAVDHEGNVYVADTFNNRVEIFDADGKFVSTFGKAGDGPGYFARPKGIAIDADGHVWVADAVQDRIQVFTREGRLLLYMGTHGGLPGQFSSLAGLAIDKNNRIITSEQYPGRVQIFRYVTDDEAKVERARRDAQQSADDKKDKLVDGKQEPTLSSPAKPTTQVQLGVKAP